MSTNRNTGDKMELGNMSPLLGREYRDKPVEVRQFPRDWRSKEEPRWVPAIFGGHAGGRSCIVYIDDNPYGSCVCYANVRTPREAG